MLSLSLSIRHYLYFAKLKVSLFALPSYILMLINILYLFSTMLNLQLYLCQPLISFFKK
jgi:hypothetical protein